MKDLLFERSRELSLKLLHFYGNFSTRCARSKNNWMRGVTFIELILVVSIMLILSVMAPIFYSRFLLQNSTLNAADQLVGSLRKAQMYSMMSKNGSGWSVNYGGIANTITLYQGAPPFSGRPNPVVDEKFELNSKVLVNGITDITFTRVTGKPNVTPTVTISSPGNNSQLISVNSEGVVNK